MRDFLDEILAFINAESLTDEEFDLLPEGTVQSYNEYVYRYLRSIMQGRESVSSGLNKLKSFFVAKGVSVSETTIKDPVSQIMVGAALE